MAKPERLLKRATGYYHRVRVPADLRSHFKGEFIVRSLRTKDPSEAKRLLKIRDGELEQEFAKLRQQRSLPAAVEEPPRVIIESRHDLRQVAISYRRQIEQAELTAEVDFYEKASQDPEAFWRGDLVPLPRSTSSLGSISYALRVISTALLPMLLIFAEKGGLII